MIVIYPVGIPLIFAWMLWRKKDRIKMSVEEREKDESLLGMEFLFDNYKPKFWYV